MDQIITKNDLENITDDLNLNDEILVEDESDNGAIKYSKIQAIVNFISNIVYTSLDSIRLNNPKINGGTEITKSSTEINAFLEKDFGTATGNIPIWESNPSNNSLVIAGNNGLKTTPLNSGFNAEIVDNLETNDSSKVLSARQGKILNDLIEGLVFDASGMTPILNVSNYDSNIIRIVVGLPGTAEDLNEVVVLGSYKLRYCFVDHGSPEPSSTEYTTRIIHGTSDYMELPTEDGLYSNALTDFWYTLQFITIDSSKNSDVSSPAFKVIKKPLSASDIAQAIVDNDSENGDRLAQVIANNLASNPNFYSPSD